MILNADKKGGFVFAEYAKDVLYETGEKTVNRQLNIAKLYFNRQTGSLLSQLSSRPFHVQKHSQGANLIFTYPKVLRFLDLRKTSKGQDKKIHYPIYNKPFYGYVYGYAYNMLLYGFTEEVRNNYTTILKEAFKSPIKINL